MTGKKSGLEVEALQGKGWLGAASFAVWVGLWVFLLFLPLSLDPASRLPDDGDALQATWMMAWVAHQLPRDPLNLFDANVYYPHPKGLAYSEHFVPQGLIVGLLMALGCNLILAYNLLAALSLVGIALAARLWMRELGTGEAGAWSAGIVAALGTFNLEIVSRLHVLFMPWIPLGLFFLYRFFRQGKLSSAIGFAACFVAQGLSSHYYLISLPFFLGPVLLGLFWLYPERRNRRDLLRLAAPLFLGALIFIPIELPYLEIFSRYRFHQDLPQGMDLARYVVPPSNSLLYGGLFRHAAEELSDSNHHFTGYLALLLALVGLVWALRRRNEDRVFKLAIGLGGLGLLFALLSAGAETQVGGFVLGPGIYRLFYEYVPFFNYARVPERLSVYFILTLALLAGLGARALLERVSSSRRKAVLLGALLVLLPLEHAQIPRRPYPRIPTPAEVPAVYHWLADQPGDFAVVELPVYKRRFIRFYAYENYFSTFHWKRIPFGRPSFYPPALEYLLWSLSDFPSPASTRVLQSLGVRYLIYHPQRDPRSESVRQRLLREPRFSLVQTFPPAAAAAQRLGYGDDMVFAVEPEAMPPEPAEPTYQPIPSGSWRFKTSSDEDPGLAVDGRIETGWSSGRAQEKGQFFEIDFGGEYRVGQISLGFVYPYREFPRSVAVNGYHGSHRWRRLELRRDVWGRARLVHRLVRDPVSATLDLVLEEPVTLERIRLFIHRSETGVAPPPWRIPEIQVLGPVEMR